MSYIGELRQLVGHRPLQLPGTGVLVWRMNPEAQVEILLQLRSDHNKWGLLGGGLELGDSYKECAVRELYQESGLIASEEKLKLLNVYAGKEHVTVHPNGDIVHHTVVLYSLRYDETQFDKGAEISTETKRLDWLSLSKIKALLEDGEEATHFFPNNVPIIRDVINVYFEDNCPRI